MVTDAPDRSPVWPNRDPLGEEGGINLYEFSGNSPVHVVDSDGRLHFLATAAIGAGLNFAYQYYMHDGNTKCIDWADVALSGATSGMGFGLFANYKRLKEVPKAIKKIEKIQKKLGRNTGLSKYARGQYEKAKEAIPNVGKAAVAVSAGFAAKKAVDANTDDLRLRQGNSDECD